MPKFRRVHPRGSRQGFSLTAVLVAVGFLGFLSMIFSNIMSQTMKGQASVDMKSKAQDFELTLRYILGVSGQCQASLKFGAMDYRIAKSLLPSVGAPPTPVQIPVPSLKLQGHLLSTWAQRNGYSMSAAGVVTPTTINVSSATPASGSGSVANAASANWDRLQLEQAVLEIDQAPIAANTWIARLKVWMKPQSATSGSAAGFQQSIPIRLSFEEADASNLKIGDCTYSAGAAPEELCAEMGGTWLGNETGKMGFPRCNMTAGIRLGANEWPKMRFRDVATAGIVSVDAPKEGIPNAVYGFRVSKCVKTTNLATGARYEYDCDGRVGTGYKCWFNGTSWVQQYRYWNASTSSFTNHPNVYRYCDAGVVVNFDPSTASPENNVYQALDFATLSDSVGENAGYADNSIARRLLEHDSSPAFLKCQTAPNGKAAEGTVCSTNQTGGDGAGAAAAGSCLFVRRLKKARIGGTAGATNSEAECKNVTRSTSAATLYERSVYCAVDKDPNFSGWGRVAAGRTFAISTAAATPGWLLSSSETVAPCHTIELLPSSIATEPALTLVTDGNSVTNLTSYSARPLATLPASVGSGLLSDTSTSDPKIDLSRVKQCVVVSKANDAHSELNHLSVLRCNNDSLENVPISGLAETYPSGDDPGNPPPVGACVYLQNIRTSANAPVRNGWYYITAALSARFFYNLSASGNPVGASAWTGALTYRKSLTDATTPLNLAAVRHCNAGVRISE